MERGCSTGDSRTELSLKVFLRGSCAVLVSLLLVCATVLISTPGQKDSSLLDDHMNSSQSSFERLRKLERRAQSHDKLHAWHDSNARKDINTFFGSILRRDAQSVSELPSKDSDLKIEHARPSKADCSNSRRKDLRIETQQLAEKPETSEKPDPFGGDGVTEEQKHTEEEMKNFHHSVSSTQKTNKSWAELER